MSPSTVYDTRLIATCCLLLLLAAAPALTGAERSQPEPISRDDWVEPHVWTRRSTIKRQATTTTTDTSDDPDAVPPSCHDCPPCPVAAATAATAAAIDHHSYGEFAYRKLVNYMINERRMRVDADTGRLHRTLHIELSRDQYAAIRAAGADLHDVDAVLQDVWEQSAPPPSAAAERVSEALWSWSEATRHFWHAEVLASRWLVHTIQAAGAVGVYMLARRYRIRVGVLLAGVAAFAVYRYLDGECHRRLEIERMADLLQRGNNEGDASKNPCAESAGSTSWLWSWLPYDSGSRREECIRFLESRYERRCDAKALYDGFMQTFVYGTLQAFFMAIVGVTENVRAVHGLVGMVLVVVLIYGNVGVLILSCFKYVIGPVLMRWTGRQEERPKTETIIVQTVPEPVAADKLSGENIERLLSITESQTRLVTAMAETFRQQCTIVGDAPEAIEASDDKPSNASGSPQAKAAGGYVSPVSVPVMLSSGVETVDGGGGNSGGLAQPSSSNCSSELGDTASEDDIVILEHFQSQAESREDWEAI